MKTLVTGGTRGIGEAIASILQKAGHEVTVTGTSPRGRAPRRCSYISCDFSDSVQTEAFAKGLRAEPWDVVVNNAGINKIGQIEDYDPGDFERIQRVNVMAPFLICRAVIPGMRRRKFGRILNITSIFSLVGRAERAAYSTAKSGILGLTRTIALETAGDNVLVNCLAPGFVDTGLTRKILKARGIAKILRQIPQGRLAKPGEIAQVARFLVSLENSYMTGQSVCVDGGFTSA